MAWEKCSKCGKEVFLEKYESNCPDCGVELTPPKVQKVKKTQQGQTKAEIVGWFSGLAISVLVNAISRPGIIGGAIFTGALTFCGFIAGRRFDQAEK
jgi:DNA-directed RNA polymerase subunit RPC12/RpoP